MSNSEVLGEVTVPSGTVVVVDAGLLGLDDVSRFSVEVGGIDPGPTLEVLGDRMDKGDYEHNWRSVKLVVRPGVRKAWSEQAGKAVANHARLMFADKKAFPSWKHEEPMDGKADFVWWGRDAKLLAKAISAPALPGGQFGWVGMPYEEAVSKGKAADQLVQEKSWWLRTDFRPHSHHYQVLDGIRSTPTQSGMVDVNGARFCGFHTTWGDGVFPVFKDMGADGKLVAVRVQLATEQAKENMDAVTKPRGEKNMATKTNETPAVKAENAGTPAKAIAIAPAKPTAKTNPAEKKAPQPAKAGKKSRTTKGKSKSKPNVRNAAKKAKPQGRPRKVKKAAKKATTKGHPRKKRLTTKQKGSVVDQYHALIQGGKNASVAAKSVGVSYPTLLAWEKKLGKKMKKKPGRKPGKKLKSAKKPAKRGGHKPGHRPGRPPSGKGHLKKALKPGKRKARPMKTKGQQVLVTPQGYRIEGISTKDLIRVLKAVR